VLVAHGGSIEIGDEDYPGAEFVLKLPRAAGGAWRADRGGDRAPGMGCGGFA
jgi:hypothetical protein